MDRLTALQSSESNKVQLKAAMARRDMRSDLPITRFSTTFITARVRDNPGAKKNASGPTAFRGQKWRTSRGRVVAS